MTLNEMGKVFPLRFRGRVCILEMITEGSCVMLLLGPGKIRISQILIIVLKNRSNEIRINEIRIRRELPVCQKIQLSVSCGTQKSAKIPLPVAKMI